MIYYIYKVRRKQTSIRSSRSVLTHRYLRYISWISWNGGHRPPQAGSSTPSRSCAHDVFAAMPIPQGRNSCAPTAVAIQKRKKISPVLFHREKEKHLSSLFPHSSHTPFLPHCSARELSRIPPATHPRPVHRLPHVVFCGPPINKKMRAHGIAPRTRKSVDFSLKKNARRHAWLSRSCFGRKNLFIDGPHCPFSFLLFYKGKEKRKQKQIQQVRIHRSDSLRSSSRCTRLAPRLVR